MANGEGSRRRTRSYGERCQELHTGNLPKDDVNELRINAQVIACSTNHPSVHHYPDRQRFLYYLGNGRFRLYDPTKDGVWQVIQSGPKKASEGIKSNEGLFTQVGVSGQVNIPKEILEKLSLKTGDFIAFTEDRDGKIQLRKAELRIVP